MWVLDDVTLATMAAGGGAYGLVEDGAVLIEGDRIAWVGARDALPAAYAEVERRSGGGRLAAPALIDCHTHLVWGGDRAAEFEQRLLGASYEAIARQGGGILSTVRATREASEDALFEAASRRVLRLIGEGVGVVEVKSGYGLDIETELKMLRVARRLGQRLPLRVRTSFLGAHALPPEWKNDRAGYIEEVCLPALRMAAAEGLVDAVDGFCEGIAFSVPEIARVFDEAARLGLPLKLHAEQLSLSGGALLAAERGALSADHLEYLDEAGARAMADAGTVAVLLPGAFYSLREKQAPPVDELRVAGCAIAVATDLNPGSSPLHSLLLAMNMAATLFRLTPEEALAGVTRNAAKALGLEDCGELAPGKRADIALYDVARPAELVYRIGDNPLAARIHGGVWREGEGA